MTDMSWTANSSPLKGRDPKAESLLMEKIAILQKEFSEIDVDHNSLITRDELFGYLDRKSATGKPFDRAIAQELFEHMDKNTDGEITVNEFIKTYIEADEILRKKAETAKINKDYYSRQYEECVKKAEDARATERYTAAGITQGSVVHVVVIEARPNRPAFGAPGNYYVEVSLDRQQVTKTKVLSGIDPQWNEKFSFEVINPESQLRFVLFDQTRGADMEGDVNLPLGEISNQEIHDVWIDLYERNNQKSKAQIHVKLQWIHSKAKYYTIAAQKWQETIKKEEEELHEYERYIESLHEPFEGLRNLSKSTKQSAAIEIKGITEIEGQFVAIMNKAVFAVAKEQNPGEGFWRNISRLGCLAEIVIALFITFARPDFFDICVGLVTFLYIETGLLKEIISPRIIAAAVAASAILLDLIWFFIYSGNWTDTQYKDGNLEVGTRRFSLFLTFINILFKIVFAAVLYMYHLQIVKQRNSIPKVIMRDVPV